MKTFKKTISVLALLIVAVITGCSENPLSYSDSGTSQSRSESSASDSESRLSTFAKKIKLKCGESYTITRKQANLESFREVYVSECNRNEVRISSSTIDSDLNCTWIGVDGFGLEDITIENTGKFNKIIDITLFGVKFKQQN